MNWRAVAGACRECTGLAYRSQREEFGFRRLRRAWAVRARLGLSADLARPLGAKPHRMHRKKYERLRQHYGHDEQRFVAMYLATGGKLQEVDVSSLGEPHPAAKALYFTVNDLEAAHGRAKSLHCLSSEDVHDAPGGGIVVRPWGERSFYVHKIPGRTRFVSSQGRRPPQRALLGPYRRPFVDSHPYRRY